MKPTDLLHDEHCRLLGLLQRCAGAAGTSRARLAREVSADVRAHMRLEEEVLYPVLRRRRAEASRAAVREALEQHNRLDGLIAELEAVEPEDAQFAARLAALEAAFEAHVEREEGAVFPAAAEHLAPARLEKLAARLRARSR